MQDMIVTEAEDEFKMLDKDGNGCIAQEEFRAPYLDSFDAGAGTGGKRSKEMKKVDKDAEKAMKKELKEAFKEMDENKDNCLTKKEMEAGVKTYVDDCEGQFHAIDHSGDNRISRNEVYEYASDGISEQEITQEQVEEIFNSYDADKSGFVNEEEFCGCSGIGGGGNATNATDAKDEKKKEEKKEFLLTAIPKRARARLLKSISFARKAGVRISKACRIVAKK